MQNRIFSIASLKDEELVALAQGGDDSAFSELIRRNYNACLRTAVRILRNPHDAEDELQNACWKAFEHLGQFQRDSKFSTWLTRIVVNQCLMRLRRERRANFVHLGEQLPGEENVTLELPDPGQTPEKKLGSREVAELLEQEVRRIPPLMRDVFVLRNVEELSMSEVARRLGISVAAAKSRLLRARLELQSRLARHCPTPGAAALTA